MQQGSLPWNRPTVFGIAALIPQGSDLFGEHCPRSVLRSTSSWGEQASNFTVGSIQQAIGVHGFGDIWSRHFECCSKADIYLSSHPFPLPYHAFDAQIIRRCYLMLEEGPFYVITPVKQWTARSSWDISPYCR